MTITRDVITENGKRTKKRVRAYEVNALTNPGTQVPEGYVVCRLRGRRPVLMKARQHWKDKRSKMPLPQLPPVQARYVPSAMPELRQQVHQDALPTPETLRSGSGSSGGDQQGRHPDAAPALRRSSAGSADAPSETPRASRSLTRRWNPAASLEADEDL